MNAFFTMIQGDYRQRTRSYSFLITLAISIYIGYTFVPPPDAGYTTLRVGTYIGSYNSAWIGYVTAIMTSVFLSLIGFFLVNNSIRKDIETEVGMIIATTRVSNFRYLMSKVVSNYLVLLTIVGLVLAMSVVIFFLRSSNAAFEISAFLTPYLFTTLPAMFFISCLAVTAEVLLGRKAVLQYLGFFILFNVLIGTVQTARSSEVITWFDPFGVKVVTMGFEQYVKHQLQGEGTVTSMGFIFGSKDKLRVFEFNGFAWPASFLFSRLLWMAGSIGLVYGCSLVFHRFDLKERARASAKARQEPAASKHASGTSTFSMANLPPVTTDYSMKAFIRTELLLLIRKGSRWLWLINLGGMVALTFTPLSIAHQFVLPILWFFQVNRISDLTTKEKFHRVHYFSFAAYQPLRRLLPAQLISGMVLLILLAAPLLLRQLFAFHFLQVFGILIGSVFLVLLAAALGIVSGGKKLFEILFFLLAYANVNQVPFADYFGFEVSAVSISTVVGISIVLLLTTYLVRQHEIRHT